MQKYGGVKFRKDRVKIQIWGKPAIFSHELCLYITRFVRHGASRRTRFRNPLDFTWISDFRLDFWISRGFLDFKVDFWISCGFPDFKVDFYILLFVILKILLINKPSQPGCTQNRHFTVHRDALRTACIIY